MIMEESYLKTLKDLVAIADGTSEYLPTPSRNGTIYKLPSAKVRVSLSEESKEKGRIPILLGKYVRLDSILAELLWFLSGDTNTAFLTTLGVKIWDAWADINGDLGPIYGAQFRNASGSGVDQYRDLIHNLKEDPHSRRHVMTLWSPSQLEEMALPPCHGTSIIFSVTRKADGEYLNLSTSQRSADWYLGVPFNITSYYMLLAITAKMTGYKVGEMDYSFSNVHLYDNQLPAAREYIKSAESCNINDESKFPKFVTPWFTLEELELDKWTLQYYGKRSDLNSHFIFQIPYTAPVIAAPVSP